MTKFNNYMNVNELHEEANIGYLLEFYVLVNFIVMKIGTRFHGNSKAIMIVNLCTMYMYLHAKRFGATN